MKRNTKSLLVALGLAGAGALVVGTIVLWPKTASAKTNAPLPIALDANLTDQQKADVADLLNNSNDASKLAQAGWNYEKAFNAGISSDLLYKKAMSIVLPTLDKNVKPTDYDVLYSLFISTDPVELGSIAMRYQSEGFPITAQKIADRARVISGL